MIDLRRAVDKRLRVMLLAFTLIVNICFASPSSAAEISCVSKGSVSEASEGYTKFLKTLQTSPITEWCNGYLINGEIAKGDYEKVRNSLSQSYFIIPSFFLNSPGGDVDEAIKIGRLFRKYLIQTIAPNDYGKGPWLYASNSKGNPLLCHGNNCMCASACALIWFGAVTRQGIVGLHRPQILDEQFKISPPAEAAKTYRQALQKITDYLKDMEVPNPMADAMVATTSSEIQWIDETMYGLEHPPSFEEWVSASCGPFPRDELQALSELATSKDPLTASDNALQKLLGDKIYEYYYCFNTLKLGHVNNLTPP